MSVATSTVCYLHILNLSLAIPSCISYYNMIGHIMQEYYNESIIIGHWSIHNHWNMIIVKPDERDLNTFLDMF
jgi:hypothetical protein